MHAQERAFGQKIGDGADFVQPSSPALKIGRTKELDVNTAKNLISVYMP
jgi:hypothetical protein